MDCRLCGAEIVGRRADAKYCSTTCQRRDVHKRERLRGYQQAYYRNNADQREKAKARAKSRRLADPVRVRDEKAAYYRANKAAFAAQSKRWRESKQAERRSAWQAWKHENPEKAERIQRRYRFRVREKLARLARERYASDPARRRALSAASSQRRRAMGWKPNHAGRSFESRRNSSIQQLKWRLRRQFSGEPPAYIVEARVLALMLKWEERAARKAHA